MGRIEVLGATGWIVTVPEGWVAIEPPRGAGLLLVHREIPGCSLSVLVEPWRQQGYDAEAFFSANAEFDTEGGTALLWTDEHNDDGWHFLVSTPLGDTPGLLEQAARHDQHVLVTFVATLPAWAYPRVGAAVSELLATVPEFEASDAH